MQGLSTDVPGARDLGSRYPTRDGWHWFKVSSNVDGLIMAEAGTLRERRHKNCTGYLA